VNETSVFAHWFMAKAASSVAIKLTVPLDPAALEPSAQVMTRVPLSYTPPLSAEAATYVVPAGSSSVMVTSAEPSPTTAQ
jgi:hypothetical protein